MTGDGDEAVVRLLEFVTSLDPLPDDPVEIARAVVEAGIVDSDEARTILLVPAIQTALSMCRLAARFGRVPPPSPHFN